jgi:hypothetical protein
VVAHREEVVGRLLLAVPDDVQLALEPEPEPLLEGAASLRVGNAVRRVEVAGHDGILGAPAQVWHDAEPESVNVSPGSGTNCHW